MDADPGAAADQAGVALAAISGTFNAAHPDPAHRQTYLERFPHLCAAARDLQIGIITLSSGSRDPEDMWRWHPDNTTAAGVGGLPHHAPGPGRRSPRTTA